MCCTSQKQQLLRDMPGAGPQMRSWLRPAGAHWGTGRRGCGSGGGPAMLSWGQSPERAHLNIHTKQATLIATCHVTAGTVMCPDHAACAVTLMSHWTEAKQMHVNSSVFHELEVSKAGCSTGGRTLALNTMCQATRGQQQARELSSVSGQTLSSCSGESHRLAS